MKHANCHKEHIDGQYAMQNKGVIKTHFQVYVDQLAAQGFILGDIGLKMNKSIFLKEINTRELILVTIELFLVKSCKKCRLNRVEGGRRGRILMQLINGIIRNRTRAHSCKNAVPLFWSTHELILYETQVMCELETSGINPCHLKRTTGSLILTEYSAFCSFYIIADGCFKSKCDQFKVRLRSETPVSDSNFHLKKETIHGITQENHWK